MQNNPLASAGAILSAMAILGWVDQFVRLISETSSLWAFHVMRTAMMWAMVLLWLAIARKGLRVVNWRGLIARSVIMSTALIIYFGALAFLPVAQVAAGLFTAPIWVLIFSVALFGLRIGVWRIGAVALGFVGIMLVLSPDLSELSALTFMPIVAGAFYAVAVIGTREWCPEEGALELAMGIFTAMALWGVVLGTVMSVLAPEVAPGSDGWLTRGFIWPAGEALMWTVAQAVASLIAVILLTRGYQLAEASYATVFEYSVLVFSAFFGWLVWGDVLPPWGWFGIPMIAMSGVIIAFRAKRAR